MFKKKPLIKTLSPLRSSDRRKIADQIISDYQLEIPEDGNTEQQGDEGATLRHATGIGALRNSLLPEGSLSAKFTTTAGPDLKEVSGIVYVGAASGEEPRVLWIRYNERLFPTVYTVWRHPRLLPLLHTPDVVLRKLHGGADLMTPGLARGPPFPEKAAKGAVVAIASLEKPSVPMVVGVCEIDVSALTRVQGVKGHAVRGVHWDGDELWAWSQGGKPGVPAPDQIEGWDDGVDDHALDPGVAQLELEDSDNEHDQGGVTLDEDKDIKVPSHNNYVNGEDAIEHVAVEREEMSTKDIDQAFRNAFLYAIHHHMNAYKDDPHHGLDFPIPQSLVISNLVLPYLPIFSPADAASLQIKKTSWKNAKKFIKTLEKEKIIKSKDRNGGEVVVMDIDFNDSAVTSFIPYKLPKKETSGADGGGGVGGKVATAGNSSDDSSIGQTLGKLTLVRPKEKLAPLFQAANASTKSLFLPAEIRPIITTYIESENLVSPSNKRLVNLNPILANAVFNGQSSIDREVLAKGNIPRDALIDRILQSCSPYWAILRNAQTRDDVKPRAGQAPSIQIVLETRSGNKTVSKVSGVETFYINPQPLAEELQKACASSTSVGQLVGSSPKNPVMEIMVQGPQKDVIVKALEKRGVRREWVEILDKTKGKKR